MNRTTISWVLGPDGAQGFTWNPFVGCSPNKVSPGCANCYAERLAATRLAHLPAYHGLSRVVPVPDIDGAISYPRAEWSGEVRFFAEKLAEPLRRRKPSGIFVGDMGDIALLPNEQLSAIWGVMAACPQHRFYILSKRPERLREYLSGDHRERWARNAVHLAVWDDADGLFDCIACGSWVLPNVWIGASASTQADLDRVAPELLRIPAAVRFISYEPALEAITFKREWIGRFCGCGIPGDACDGWKSGRCDFEPPRISFVIAGGESGPNVRPCHVDWLRSIVRQCREAGVAPWIKQLGANAHEEAPGHGTQRLRLRDRAGSDMDEWPEALRVREMPEAKL